MTLSANPQFEVLFNTDLLAVLEAAIELEQNMASENDMSITNVLVHAQQKVSQDSSLFKSKALTFPQKLIDLSLLEDISTLNLNRLRASETIIDVTDAGYSLYDKGIAQQEAATIAKLTTDSVLVFLENIKKLRKFRNLNGVEAIDTLQRISQQLPEIIRGFENLIRSLIKSITQLTDDELIVLEDIRYNLLNNQRIIKEYFEEAKSIWLSLVKPTDNYGLFDNNQYNFFVDSLVDSESKTIVGQISRSTDQDADQIAKVEITTQLDKITNSLINPNSLKSFSYMITNLDLLWSSVQTRIKAKKSQKITTTDLILSINNLLDTIDDNVMANYDLPFTKSTHELPNNDRFDEADQAPIIVDNLLNLDKVTYYPINRTITKSSRIADESFDETTEATLPDYLFLQQNVEQILDENNEVQITNNTIVPSFSIRDWIWSVQNQIVSYIINNDDMPTSLFDDKLQTQIIVSNISQQPTDVIVLENQTMISQFSFTFTIKLT